MANRAGSVADGVKCLVFHGQEEGTRSRVVMGVYNGRQAFEMMVEVLERSVWKMCGSLTVKVY